MIFGDDIIPLQRLCIKTTLNNEGDGGRVYRKRKFLCAIASIRRRSVFERSRLLIATVVSLMFMWSQRAPPENTRYTTGNAEQTAVDLKMFIREMCSG